MATVQSTKTATGLQGARLTVADDKLSVVLNASSEFVANPDAVESIRAELAVRKITGVFDIEGLTSALVESAKAGTEISNLVIVKGNPTVPPQDSRLEWSKDFFAKGYYVDPETKYVDYHRKAAVPAVDKDELVVKVHPTQICQAGQDVYGGSIAPPKPQASDLRAGRNVRWDPKESAFFAECAGRVKLNGRVLEVHDVYQVSGNVGASSGNIDHGGSVVIRGGVDSEFKVRAGGDIEVADVIGAADIECGGDLTAAKGISSAPGKKILVKGKIHTKYIDHGLVLADGDIEVDAEIIDSSIRTTGKLICRGRIQGGDVMAAQGITVVEAGSKAETRTTLIAGVDFRVVAAIREATEKSKQLKEELAKLEPERKRLAMLGSTMTHKQREAVTELEFKIFEAQEQYDQLIEQRKALAAQVLANKDARIIIEKQVNAGTVLRVLDSQLEVQNALLGPIVAVPDPITKNLTLTSVDTATKE